MKSFKSIRRAGTPAVFLFALFFYLMTMQPSLSWGDGVRLQREVITGESFILAELVDTTFAPDPFPFSRLGIAAWDHPVYVILGYSLVQVGTAIFPASAPLWWVNLISVVFGAGAASLVFNIGFRLTGSRLGSVAAALLLIVSHTFWWHAATPEVYTLHIFFMLASLVLFIEYFIENRPNALLGSVFILGLALANHFLAGLAVFPILAFIAWHFRHLKSQQTFHPRTILSLVLVFLIGISPILIQAVRLLRTFSFGELFGTVIGLTFFDNLPSMSIFESFVRYIALLVIQFSPIGFVLGVIGLWSSLRAKEKAARLIPLFYITYMLFGVFYRVPDQFAFHLTSYVAFALAVPFGWDFARKQLNPNLNLALQGTVFLTIFLAPFFYASLAANLPKIGVDEQAFGVPQIGTGQRDGLDFYINPNKRGDQSAYLFGSTTIEALPADAIVLAQWYTDTDEYFIFRYFQVVEGRRPDVSIQGWPKEDPFLFDSAQAVELIENESGQNAVYLASLSDDYYNTEALMIAYCIYPENNLYRVVPRNDSQTPNNCFNSN